MVVDAVPDGFYRGQGGMTPRRCGCCEEQRCRHRNAESHQILAQRWWSTASPRCWMVPPKRRRSSSCGWAPPASPPRRSDCAWSPDGLRRSAPGCSAGTPLVPRHPPPPPKTLNPKTPTPPDPCVRLPFHCAFVSDMQITWSGAASGAASFTIKRSRRPGQDMLRRETLACIPAWCVSNIVAFAQSGQGARRWGWGICWMQRGTPCWTSCRRLSTMWRQ